MFESFCNRPDLFSGIRNFGPFLALDGCISYCIVCFGAHVFVFCIVLLARIMWSVILFSFYLLSGVSKYVVFLFRRYLMALILCSMGWQESRGMIVPVAVGLRKVLNVILLSEGFVMVTCRKLVLLSRSVSIVYFMEGVILLNLYSTS